MMILHILTKGPHSSACQQMVRALGEQDSMVLIEEGVCAVLDPAWAIWQQYASRIFILSEDLMSRGLASIAAKHQLPTLDLDGFVALTEQYEKTVTWY